MSCFFYALISAPIQRVGGYMKTTLNGVSPMTTFIGGVIGAAINLINQFKQYTTTQLDRIQQFVNDAARPEAYA